MHDLRMPDVNTVLIAGNLTRDPAFRHTTNGTPVTNFWIASNRRFRDNTGQWRENVCYVGVVAWYKLAENCANNLKKGHAVVVEGELQSRSLKSDDGRNRNIVEIKARRVQFLNRREEVQEFEGDEEFEYLDDDSHTDSLYLSALSQTKDVETDLAQKPSVTPQSKSSSAGNSKESRFDFGYRDLEL